MRLQYALIVAILLPFKGHAAPDTGAIYQLDPGRTQVRVHLGKSGLFGFMGDNHIIDVPISEGTLVSDPSSNQPQSLKFTIQTGQVKVLDPDIADDNRVEVQNKMIGENVLDVLKYPTIQFSSTAFKKTKDENTWRIPGKITVKDQTVSIEITAEINIEPSHFTAQGQAELRLSHLGIKPPGAGAGTIKVKNLFKVEFESYGKK
ncbi:MAG: YceI family protein [Verrucomicrobia bacterium]|nr:YceI family protein [Verrucomicrobiota bacterium]